MLLDTAADCREAAILIQRGDCMCKRCRVGELCIVIKAEDDAAVPQGAASITPTSDTMVAVQCDKCRVGSV